MLAGAHQGQLDLILDILDMQRAAMRLATDQRIHHIRGQLLDQFAHARRRRTLPAVDGDEGLGHGNGNLARLERNHRAIATDHFVLI